jgi:tetratricopeptide (TPR) repeat protein
LTGLELAITGRLASMRRDEALERIAAAGATYVASPSSTTHLLVVGQGGPEEVFLSRLGLEERLGELDRLFTTAQLARMLDVPQSELRAWVRHQLIRPVKEVRRLAFFDFRQVAGAKALARLAASGVSPGRIRRSLAQLEGWWPSTGASLAQLEVIEAEDARGGSLFVRTNEGSLAETSGQLRLDFDAPGELDAEADPALDAPGRDELWFRRGIQLEEEDRPEEAVVAYAKALEAGDPSAELAFNLGNLLYALERPADAAPCLALATEIDEDYVEAWNNLGNALAATGDQQAAVDAFERALAIEPDYPDAHFNLAETLATLGRTGDARNHWRAYLELDPHSEWALEVRARLRRTKS